MIRGRSGDGAEKGENLLTLINDGPVYLTGASLLERESHLAVMECDCPARFDR